MSWPILGAPIATENDVVAARQRARQIAAAVGFDHQDQVRIATAVSEIARNAYSYGGGGRIDYAIDGPAPPQHFVIRIVDQGPGIADLDHVLSGSYVSKTGMGVGMIGARRLMDSVEVVTAAGEGTTVQLRKAFTERMPAIKSAQISDVADVVRRALPLDPFAELREQNRELIEASDQLRRQQQELQAVNAELAETNRGVLALYAELEDRAAELRLANEVRARFHSNVSHELRTPIQSIMAISQLVLDRTDGELTSEQERQLDYIRQSAMSLSAMVDDLLDVAKAEAGRLEVQLTTFSVDDMFGGLRGVLRPLRPSDSVDLNFDDAAGLPPLQTDETKLVQVLRNLISNALKFTEVGEVRVTATYVPGSDEIIFKVADTGVGIAPKDHVRIFEEFGQVPNRLQARSKGTGLGLSLSRRLTELLDGHLRLESSLGEGATFSLTIPRQLRVRGDLAPIPTVLVTRSVRRVLVIDDDPQWRYVLRQFMAALGIGVREAADGTDGLASLEQSKPDAIFLDIAMPVMDGYAVLERLQVVPESKDIPVFVLTSSPLDDVDYARLAHAYVILPKSEVSKDRLANLLREVETQ